MLTLVLVLVLVPVLVPVVLGSAGGKALGQLDATFFDAIDHPAIRYSTRQVSDRVAALNGRLASGAARLRFDPTAGYLRSLLDALEIPVESQLAVFSKTSLQSPLISPSNPRTIFFNDSVAVAWMRGGFIEVASQDPQQGMVFYALPQQETAAPQLVRIARCLGCHYSYATLGVPGALTRSVVTDPAGVAMPYLGNYTTDHRSPFDERWAGWYVTGSSGSMRHLGNATVADRNRFGGAMPQNVRSLDTRFDTSAYLSPHSDIVALMVFDHQMTMMNLTTRIGWETRVGSADLSAHAKEFVDYLLFVDEKPLPGRIQGSSDFARTFAARGPRDSKGRSLRDLDLDRRLLRYPCSYFIYSAAFDALPADMVSAVYRRMWEVLSGQDHSPRYGRLTASDRGAIVEILRETKPGLPPYFL